jgi:hypothetical protein
MEPTDIVNDVKVNTNKKRMIAATGAGVLVTVVLGVLSNVVIDKASTEVRNRINKVESN